MFDRFDLPGRCCVLELGCGTGALWAHNAARIPPGWQITLSDFSAGMLAEAEKSLRRLGRPFAFKVVDAGRIPFGEAAFDVVIANHMLYHVPQLDEALGEIRRVLRPGGRLFAATNGAAHMAELREIVRAAAPELGFSRKVNVRAFSLENGAACPSRHFDHVTLHRYDDALAVTEAEPLIDYVRSLRGAEDALTGEKLAEVARAIRRRLAADGALRITKDSGMFEATRPA